jgi:hypothetical protein
VDQIAAGGPRSSGTITTLSWWCHGYLSPPALACLPATAFIHVDPFISMGCVDDAPPKGLQGMYHIITRRTPHLLRVFCLSALSCLALSCCIRCCVRSFFCLRLAGDSV